MSQIPINESFKNFKAIANRCEEFWRKENAIVRHSFPLVHEDPTVLFVNAGITPFKSFMLEGSEVPTTSVVQHCLRTYWNEGTRFHFRMLTVVGMARNLMRITSATFRMLADVGYASTQLYAVVDPRDSDLVRALDGHLPTHHIHLQEGNTEAYWTRWTLGHGLPLVGRGLTIATRRPTKDRTGHSCTPVSECGDYLSLGNIILIKLAGSSSEYVDVGIGVERLGEGIGMAESDTNQAIAMLSHTSASKLAEAKRKQLIYLCDAVFTLIDEGVKPSAKKHGYILRKLLRSIFVLLQDRADETLAGRTLQTVTPLLALENADAQQCAKRLEVIEVEAERYAKGSSGRREQGRRYLEMNRSKPAGQIRTYLLGTLGLTTREIDEILSSV